jgi:hypothetical protein
MDLFKKIFKSDKPREDRSTLKAQSPSESSEDQSLAPRNTQSVNIDFRYVLIVVLFCRGFQQF